MKRIFIVSSHPMFGRGVETLLRKQPGIELVGRDTDVKRAVESIKALRPDVTILDYEATSSDWEYFITSILRERIGCRVIGLNLENNTIFVHRTNKCVVQDVSDLMNVIEDDSSAANRTERMS